MTITPIEERLREENPQAKITVLQVDDSGPYQIYDVVIRKRVMAHNPNYPDDNVCLCGHVYYRHFDPCENWDAVGCKHCGCGHFVHEANAERLSPFARMKRFSQWHVQLEDYLVQWEIFGHVYYETLRDYLGATMQEWTDITNPPSLSSTFVLNAIGSDEEFVEVV